MIILNFFVFVFCRTQNEDLRKEIKDMEKSFREKVRPKLFGLFQILEFLNVCEWKKS